MGRMDRLRFLKSGDPAADCRCLSQPSASTTCAHGIEANVPSVDGPVFPLRSSLYSERRIRLFPLRNVWCRTDNPHVFSYGPVYARVGVWTVGRARMTGHSHGGLRGGFVEHTILGLRAALNRALYAEQTAASRGLLQRLDPRVKVAGLFSLIAASSMAAKLWVVAAILGVTIVLAALSHLSIWVLATRVWVATLTFSAALSVPAIFLTPGRVMYRLPIMHWPVSAQGLTSAGLLALRSETAASLGLVLVFTTPWMHVLKALRMFRVPVVFVVILSMTCRYIMLMLEAASEMFESRKSRTVGTLDRTEQRRIAILTSGALLSRTLQLSDEVHLAMQARGFRGEVYIIDDFCMNTLDWLALVTFGGLAVALVWVGR